MPAPLSLLSVEDLDHVLAHTREHWLRAKGASFFITGGTGFVGHWLLETLAYANDQLQLGLHAEILTRDPSAFAARAPHLARRTDLKFIAGDVRHFKPPTDAFTHIVHAATTSGRPVSPEEMTEVIVDGTRRVLGTVRGASNARLLYVSSGAVYGPQPPTLAAISEDYAGGPPAGDPAHAYGRGKRVAEQLCLDAWQAGGPQPVIARCFAFVGPHLPLDAHFAAGNFLRDALAGKPIRVAGDGPTVRSYLYAADLAIWLWTLLFNGRPGRAYNVGSEEALSIAELARTAAALHAPPLPVHIARAPVLDTPPSRYVPDTTRARQELALKSDIRLGEALRRSYRWHTL
jgi:dTDP-glucose 4,6-dehydratase